MSDAPCAVLGTAYCPPVEYFMAAAAAGSVLIERCGSYVKQTYRNRCRIYSCNGVLSLTVPVLQSGHDRGMSTVAIDYSKPWVQQHKRAIVSAYSTSAFSSIIRMTYLPSWIPDLIACLISTAVSRRFLCVCSDLDAAYLSLTVTLRTTVLVLWIYGRRFILKKQSLMYSGTVLSRIIRFFPQNSVFYRDSRLSTCCSTKDPMRYRFSFSSLRISSRE